MSVALDKPDCLWYSVDSRELTDRRKEKEMKKIKINGGLYDWDTIVSYMNDDIREQIHGEIAPCTEETFWERYIELDPKNEILDIVSPTAED